MVMAFLAASLRRRIEGLAVPLHAQRSSAPHRTRPASHGLLAEAGLRARQARQLLLDGKDPLVVKHAERIASRLPMNMPFKEAAQKFIEVHNPTWSNARHCQQWSNTLRDYARASLVACR